MHVVIFEGSRWDGFAPVSLTKPSFMLTSGMTTLLDKQIRFFQPERLTLWVRPQMEEYCRKLVLPRLSVPAHVNVPLDEKPAVLLSARTLMLSRYQVPEVFSVATEDDQFIPEAYVKEPGLSHEDALHRSARWEKLLQLPRVQRQSRWTRYLWDLISWNEESIVSDSIRWRENAHPHPKGAYHMVSDEDVVIAEEAKIQPGVVLDASKGPIAIDRFATVGANSVLQGPCYVGAYSLVMPLALIRPGTTIGSHCKVGGEISNSIFTGFINKSHQGYVGDSYIGHWVNLGAGTTTSNLKLTYGQISMHVPGGPVPTGRRLMGALVGDHTKTAIETRLNAGSYIGCCAMLAGAGLTPNFVRSFTFWKGGEKLEPFRLDKAMEVAARVYERRERTFGEVERGVMQYAHRAAPELEE